MKDRDRPNNVNPRKNKLYTVGKLSPLKTIFFKKKLKLILQKDNNNNNNLISK